MPQILKSSKAIGSTVASLLLLTSLAGCSAATVDSGASTETSASTETEGTAPSVDYTACAVSGSGGWNDKSFNAQVLEGLNQAEAEIGVKIIAFESKTADDFAPALQSLVDQGCNLVFSVGFDANEAVNAAAGKNQGVNFVTVDGYVIDPAATPNLKAVAYSMNQSAFLGGYLAAALSKTNVVATYGAIQNSAITDFMTGYYNGATQWGTDNGTPTTVIGWDPSTETGVFVGDFANQISAKAISAAQLKQGADVLFPVAGPLFLASAEAIKDEGNTALLIGVDSDVAVTAPDYAAIIPTSVEKRMTKAVVTIIDEASKGAFSSDAYLGTLENEGTGLSAYHEFESAISPELQARLDELAMEIKSGNIDTLAK